jgi:hypothetical protein
MWVSASDDVAAIALAARLKEQFPLLGTQHMNNILKTSVARQWNAERGSVLRGHNSRERDGN